MVVPCWDALYAHDLAKPMVQVAPVAKAFPTALLTITILPKDSVIVMDQETRNLAPGCDFPNLLLNPSEARAGRRVDEYNSARGNLHYDEDVNDREQGSLLRQEVACVDLLGVILHEGPPGLTVP